MTEPDLYPEAVIEYLHIFHLAVSGRLLK